MRLKRFLAFVVAFAMVLTMMPAMSLTAFAATTVSDEASLKAALTAGGDVVLRNDIVVNTTITVPSGVTATLDLAGFAITSGYQSGSTTKHIYPIDNYGTFTIEDSVGTGSITGRGVGNYGTITVDGAKIVAEDTNGGASIWSYEADDEVVLNNATLVGYTGVVSSQGPIEINGGTYTCYSGILEDGTQATAPTYNIRAYNGLTITGNPVMTSRHGVISVGGGEAVIENGTYTIEFTSATTSNVVYVYNDAEMTIEDGQFISDNSANKADSGAAVLVSGSEAKLTINDGTFVGMNGMVSGNANTVINAGIYSTVWDHNHYDKIEPYVTPGATITVNGTEYTNVPEYVAMIGNTTYASLAAAVTAANAGDTIVLYQDVDSMPSINKAITIKGGVAGVEVNGAVAENFPNVDGTVTFENLTFNNRVSTENVSNDQSKMTLKFKDCTFNVPAGNTYAIQAGASWNNDVLGALVVENCTFTTEATSFVKGYMIYAQCVEEVSVTDSVIDGNNAYRGAIHTGDSTNYATVATIENNTIKNFARGIQVGNRVEGSTLTIDGNTFENVAVINGETESATVYIHEVANAETTAVTYTNNEVGDSLVIFSENATGAVTDFVATFTGNTKNGVAIALEGNYSDTVYVPVGPSGTFNGGHMDISDPEEIFITTEIVDLKATESVVVKVYSGETLIATTTLLKSEYFEIGSLSVKTCLTGSSSSWNTVWEEGMPRADLAPTSGTLYVDGQEMNSATIQMRDSADAVVDWATLDGVKLAADLVISTAEELVAFAKSVNEDKNSYSGKVVVLANDINLEGSETNLWTPIGASGDSEPKFRGTFDGQGYTISNLYVKQGAAYHAAGLFGATNGTIKNLTIDTAYVESLSSGAATVNGTAVVAGSTVYGATIDNVHVKNATVKGNRYVAGIVGYMDGTVTNCSVENVTIVATPDNLTGSYDNGDKVGGIVGYCNSQSVEITNCELKGDVDITAYRDVAGIVGCANSAVKVNNNTNNAQLTITIDTTLIGERDSYNAGEFVGRNTPLEATGNVTTDTASYTNTVVKAPTVIKVATKAELDAAVKNAEEGDTILLTANIDYTGTATLVIDKAITLDLGDYTLTTYGTYGGIQLKNNCSLINGTLNHKGTVTAIKAWNVEAIEDVVIDVAFKAEGKTIGGIVIQSGTDVCVESIKNVTIKGEGLTNGIETYECGNATGNVIGSMENVTIEAKGTGMLISAPCGTATNCNITGGVSGIELWIKGTYSATLDLVGCTVEGGTQAVYVHDEFSSNPDIVNEGTLKLAADSDTEFVNEDGAVLALTIARAENVDVNDLLGLAVAEVGGVYYTELQDAIDAVEDGENSKNIVIDLLRDASFDITAWQTLAIGGDDTETFTINGNGHTLTFNQLNSDWNNVATTNDAKLILNDMTIANNGYNNGPWNRYDINFACDVELNNVKSVKALAFKADATLNDVTVDETGDNYAIWVQANGQTVNIDGLTVTSAGRGIKIDDQYVDAKEVTLNIENASFDTVKKAAILVKSAAGATITAGEKIDIADVTADNVNLVWVDEAAANTYDLVKVTGATKWLENGVVVAKIGEDVYFSLQSAIDAAEDGETITLLSDVTVTEKLTVTKDVTLDLAGKTIATSNVTGSRVIVLENGCTEFVINANGGGISGDGKSLGLIDVNTAADVTVNGGTYDFDTNNGGLFKFRSYESTITLNEVTVDTNSQVSGPGYSKNTLVVNGGTFNGATTYSGHDYNMFYIAYGAKATFNDVTINSEYMAGVEAFGGEVTLINCDITVDGVRNTPYNSVAANVGNNGTLTINGGSYSATPKAASDANGQGSTHGVWALGVNNSGGTLVINGGTFANGNYGDDSLATNARGLVYADTGATVEINGGTFNALDGIIDYFNNKGDATKNPVVTIKGGTYSADPESDWVKVAEGYVVEENEDGTYGVVIKKVPSATIPHGLQTIVNSEGRESVTFTLEDVYAENELKIELWSNDTKISTTTYNNGGVESSELTVNIVVAHGESGSWTTVWHEAPSVAYIPDQIVVYGDGEKVAEMIAPEGESVFYERYDSQLALYKALSGVYKAASVSDAAGKVVDYYATVADAIKAAEAGETVTMLTDVTGDVSVNKAGVTLDGNDKTITGKLSVTADGATVKNATVTNSGNAGYISAKDVLIENCTVTGSNGFRSCYTSGTVTFKNSTITGSTYGIHFDGSAGGNIVIDNCTITGWTSFASTIESVKIKDTEFADGNYDQLRFYQDVTLENVTFNPEMTIDFGKEGVTADFTDCSVTDGSALTEVIYLADIAEMGIKVTVDGEPIVVEASVTAGEDTAYYLTLEEALAVAEAGDTVTLLGDVEVSEIVVLDKAITLDGAGFTLTSTATRAINVDTTGEAEIKNLTIANDGNCERAVNVITKACDLTLTDVKAAGFKYTVNVAASSVGSKITISGGSYEGYAALNVAGANTTVNVENATLTGTNVYENNGSNGYATIVANATDVTINVTGGSVKAVTTDGNVPQAVVGATANATATFTLDSELIVEGTANYISVDLDNVAVNVRDDYADEMVNEGYKTEASEIEGLVKLLVPVYVAQIGEDKYESLDEAVAYAKEKGMTEVEITLLADCKFTTAVAGLAKVTFKGTDRAQTIDMNLGKAFDIGATELVFDNLTVSRLDADWLYHYSYTGKTTYNDCKMIGLFNATHTTEFIGCDFYNDDTFGNGNYSIFVYNYNGEINVTDCTFDVYERAIKVYGDGFASTTTLNITGSDFASRTADKTVVEMDYDNNSTAGKFVVNIDGESTMSGFGEPEHTPEGLKNSWFNAEHLNANDGEIEVYLAGEKIYPKSVSGDVTYGGYVSTSGTEGTESYRENMQVDIYGVYAEESLTVELWSGETKLSTTTLRKADRDDDAVIIPRPIEGTKTANIVIEGRLAGSWDTVWHAAPTAANVPDTIKVYADGTLVDTWDGGFTNEAEKAEYIELVSNYVAEIGGVKYESLQDAIDTVAEESEGTVTLLANVSDRVTIENYMAKINLVTGDYAYTGDVTLAGYGAWIVSDEELVVTSTVTDAPVVKGESETQFGYAAMNIGVNLKNGAQVRIGEGTDADGKIKNNSAVMSGSGLRFVTEINLDSTLATYADVPEADSETYQNYVVGVNIRAESSDSIVDVPAYHWQTGDIFTTALTNLAVSNYVRKFTASTYVEVDGIRYESNEEEWVTRSIYQVAAGLLINKTAEVDSDGNHTYDPTSETLIKVLNAYVNQTGIRLVLVESSLLAHDGTTVSEKGGDYGSEAFFEVSETEVDPINKTYTVTLTAKGNAVINTNTVSSTGKPFWQEYIRINNNNSQIAARVTVEEIENDADGNKQYRLVFDATGLSIAPPDNVTDGSDNGEFGENPDETEEPIE